MKQNFVMHGYMMCKYPSPNLLTPSQRFNFPFYLVILPWWVAKWIISYSKLSIYFISNHYNYFNLVIKIALLQLWGGTNAAEWNELSNEFHVCGWGAAAHSLISVSASPRLSKRSPSSNHNELLPKCCSHFESHFAFCSFRFLRRHLDVPVGGPAAQSGICTERKNSSMFPLGAKEMTHM